MSRLFQLLAGPELLWLFIYGAVTVLAKSNVPPTKGMDRFIELLCIWIPLLALATFVLWYIPVVEKQWLLLRVWVVCLVAGHFALEKGLGAYSEQGPGIGTAYIVGILLLFGALVAGSLFIKIRFSISLVFFKWLAIVSVAIMILNFIIIRIRG